MKGLSLFLCLTGLALSQGDPRKVMKDRLDAMMSKLDPTSRQGCAVPWWQGDQICDDENNNAECNWDGGDCCNNVFPLWNVWCTDCQCLDPNAPEPTEAPPCSHGFYENDPFCDDGNNIAECNFDGGACCNQTGPFWNLFCTACECLEG